MSSHNIYVSCKKCGKTESVYTGGVETYDFDDSDWEGEFIRVSKCIECKEKDDNETNIQEGTDTETTGIEGSDTGI